MCVSADLSLVAPLFNAFKSSSSSFPFYVWTKHDDVLEIIANDQYQIMIPGTYFELTSSLSHISTLILRTLNLLHFDPLSYVWL